MTLIRSSEWIEGIKAVASLLTAAAALAGVFIGQKGVNELDKTEDHIYEIRQEIDKMEDLQRFYQMHNIIMQNPTYPKQYGILPNETQQNIPSHNMKQAASAPNGYSSNQPNTPKH